MLVRLALLCAVVIVVASGSAAAHTAVQSAEPGPGETVSGLVERVELRFLDSVLPTPSVEVRGPDGDLVDGLQPATLSPDGRVVERRFDPLVDPGRHRVDYTYIAADGAEQVGAHEFTYASESHASSRFTSWPAVATIFLVALVGLVLAARRVRRATRPGDAG